MSELVTAIIWHHDPVCDEDSIIGYATGTDSHKAYANAIAKVAELTTINELWHVSDCPHINMPDGSLTYYATGPNNYDGRYIKLDTDPDDDEDYVLWYITLLPPEIERSMNRGNPK